MEDETIVEDQTPELPAVPVPQDVTDNPSGVAPPLPDTVVADQQLEVKKVLPQDVNSDDDDMLPAFKERVEARNVSAQPSTKSVEDRIKARRESGYADTGTQESPFEEPKEALPPAPAIEESTDEGVFGYLGDVLIEAPLYGAQNTVIEASQTVVDGIDWLAEAMGKDAPEILDFIREGDGWDVLKPETKTGAVVSGFAQFLVGFLPIFKGLKAAKFLGTGKKGQWFAAMGAGAITDATVFDPSDPNLMAFVQTLGLENEYTQLLATNPDDGDALNRFRNAVEGTGLGLVGDVGIRIFVRIARGMRKAQFDRIQAKDQARREQEAAEGTPEAPPEADLWDIDDTIDQQSISSAATDVNHKSGKAPATIGKVDRMAQKGEVLGFQAGTINADIGGGAGDVVTAQMKVKNVENVVYDPFNRPKDHNITAAYKLRGGQADTATVSNVLNVIPEKEIRRKVIIQAHDAVKKDGEAYFLTYEGNKSGVGAKTTAGYQNNLPTRAYVEEIEHVFGKGNVRVKNGVVIAKRMTKALHEVDPKKAQMAGHTVVDPHQAELDDMVQRLMDDTVAPEQKDINLEHITNGEDIRDVIETTSKSIAATMGDAKGGVRSHKVTEEVAELVGSSVDGLNYLYKDTVNLDARMLAARKLLASSAQTLKNTLARIKAKPGGADNLDLLQVRREAAVHAAIQSEVKGVQTQIARSLNAMKIGADAIEVEDMINALGGRGTNEKYLQMLNSFANNPKAFNKAVRRNWLQKTGDAITEYWINSILSGPATQAVNVTSNAFYQALIATEKLVAAGIRPVVGGDVTAGEAKAHMYGLIMGLRDTFYITAEGRKLMADTVKDVAGLKFKGSTKRFHGKGDEFGTSYRAFAKGDPILDRASKLEYDTHKPAISGENWNLSGPLAWMADLMGETVRLPGRFLITGDEIFKATAYRAELHSLAYRRASKEGLTGAALKREMEAIIENPPKELRLESIDAARYATFTKELDGFGRHIQGAVKTMPVLRFVLPFIRTPGNIFKSTLNRIPVVNLAMKDTQRALFSEAATATERQIAMSRTITGAGLLGMGYIGSQADWITGSAPTDPQLRASWEADGRQAYSMYNPYTKEWVAYSRMEPVGTLIGVIAEAANVMNQLDSVEAADLGILVAGSFSKSFMSKTFMTGMIDLVKAMEDPDRFWNVYMQKFTAGFVPNFLGQINRAEFDNNMRDINSVFDAIKAKVPGWSQTLPPRIDMFGEPMLYEGGVGPDTASPFWTSKDSDDPVREEVAELNMSIPKVPQIIDGIKLEPKEQAEYEKIAGKLVYKILNAVFKSQDYQKADLWLKREIVEDKIRDARNTGKDLFLASDYSTRVIDEMKFTALKELAEKGESSSAQRLEQMGIEFTPARGRRNSK